MGSQEQIDADAALAMRLQEEELRNVSFMINRPRPSAQPRLPDRRPAPYFLARGSGAGTAASARRESRRAAAASPAGAGGGGGSGVPDRQRMPYSYVAPRPQGHGGGQPPQPPPRQAPPPPQPQPSVHEQHFHHAFGGGFANPVGEMMEHFGYLFPSGIDAATGANAPGARPPGPFGGGAAHPQPPPHTFGPDMMRLFDNFPGFFPDMGGPPGAPPAPAPGQPPRGGGGAGAGATFFMGTTGGPMPGFPPGMAAEMPAFFRTVFGDAPPAFAGGVHPTTYEEFIDMIERRGNVNRGASEQEVGSLPSERFKSTKNRVTPSSNSSEAAKAAGVDDAEKCVICLADYEVDDEVTRLPCGHIFHKDCVAQWLRVNRTCPSCKRSIRPDDNV